MKAKIREILEKMFGQKTWEGQGGSDVPTTGQEILLNKSQIDIATTQILEEMEKVTFSKCEKVSQEYQKRIEERYIAKTMLLSKKELAEVIYTELKRQYKGRLPPNLKISGLASALYTVQKERMKERAEISKEE